MLFCTRRPDRLLVLRKKVLLHRRSQNDKETERNGVPALSHPSARAVAREAQQGDIALTMLAKWSLLSVRNQVVSIGSSDVFAGTDSFALGN
jgi:hypothetical protein